MFLMIPSITSKKVGRSMWEEAQRKRSKGYYLTEIFPAKFTVSWQKDGIKTTF